MGSITLDVNEGKIYVDGELRGTNTSTGTLNKSSMPIIIGNISGGGTGDGQFDGSMDNLRIYNYALLESEIQELFNEKPDEETIIEESDKLISRDFYITQNFPNPFNPSTNFELYLKKPTYVKVMIFDVSGKMIKYLINNNMNAGKYRIIWDGRDKNGLLVAGGVYFYKLNINKKIIQVNKIILLR